MLMSDQPSVAIETVIKADAERIYDVLSDLEAMASFGTEFQSGEWASGRPGQVGSQFLGRNKLYEMEWETTSTVTAAKPGKEFTWQVGDPTNHTAEWSVTMRGVPNGTEVSYRFTHGPGPSGLTSRIDEAPEKEAEYIDNRLAMIQENMVKTLEGVRRRLT